MSSLLYQDDDILLGLIGTDEQVSFSGAQATTGVLAWYQVSPQVFIWGNPDWDFQSVADIGESGATVLAFEGSAYLDVFTGQGLLDPAQIDTSYQGGPARFVAEDGNVVQQGFLTSEPYSLEFEVPEWGKPVEFLLVSDEYPVYQNTVAVRSDRLESDGECLALLVPLLQQASIDYVNDPEPINAALVDFVSQIEGGGFTLSAGKAADAVVKQLENGIVANGPDGVFGSFDQDTAADGDRPAGPGVRGQGHQSGRRPDAGRSRHRRVPRPVHLAVSRATPPGTPPWIATVAWQESSGVLRDAYDWQAASLGEPTEFTMLGSLAPEIVRLRLELYRTVENVESGLSRLERRVTAYVTSTRNGTPHCSSGLERQLDDLGLTAEVVERAASTPEELASGDARLDAIAAHAAVLAARPWEIVAGDLDAPARPRPRRRRPRRPQQHRRLLRLHQPGRQRAGAVQRDPRGAREGSGSQMTVRQ